MEEMRSRSQSVLAWKSGVFGETAKGREYIPPSRQEQKSFKALPGLLISEDCLFLSAVLILRPFFVMNFGMKE